MICANGALYRSEGGRRRGLNPFAGGQGRGCSSLSSGSGGDFLRQHAAALRIGRSIAGGNSGHSHCDDTLSVKCELPRIGPKLQGGMHVASPTVAKRERDRPPAQGTAETFDWFRLAPAIRRQCMSIVFAAPAAFCRSPETRRCAHLASDVVCRRRYPRRC
jgi:hypothetical protein